LPRLIVLVGRLLTEAGVILVDWVVLLLALILVVLIVGAVRR
jgi:hypothetical protein